jgi:para-aminobenzoate synthetase/4-amino-4-deoxychorismate lyase
VDINNPFLYHKTTHREVYKMAMKQMEKQKLDDVILLNEYGDITETTIANIVIEKNKNFYTSPLSCGLLNGTFRQYLVDQKMIKEKKLKKRDILYADKIYLINSVQKWNLAHLVNN